MHSLQRLWLCETLRNLTGSLVGVVEPGSWETISDFNKGVLRLFTVSTSSGSFHVWAVCECIY